MAAAQNGLNRGTQGFNQGVQNFNQGVQGFNQGVQGASQSVQGAGNALVANTQGLPVAYGGQGQSGGSMPLPAPSYSSINNNGLPAMPAGYNPNSFASQPAMPASSMPNALPTGFQPSMPAVASNQPPNGTGTYRPGSVGRSTGYDFSGQGTGASTMPPAFPQTANGNGFANPIQR